MKKNLIIAMVACALYGMSSCGNNTENKTAGTETKSKEPPGATIYKRTCITCHMASGEGIPGTYPPLAKSDFLSDKEKVITQVIKGSMGEITVNGKKYNSVMTPQQLNDDEIADVLSYVYSNFGNSGGPVSADEVKAVRAKL